MKKAGSIEAYAIEQELYGGIRSVGRSLSNTKKRPKIVRSKTRNTQRRGKRPGTQCATTKTGS